MRRVVIALIAVGLFTGRWAPQPEASGPAGQGPGSASSARSRTASSAPAEHRALLDRYCVTCHNLKLKTAGLALDAVDLSAIGEAAPVWEKVIQRLRSSAMPPPGMPGPDDVARDGFASWLETGLDRAAMERPNPGAPTIHRLNRTEYVNALRDLLALEIDGRELLPADDSGYGFDNIADVLSLSPSLLDRYVSASQKISRLALGRGYTEPEFETFKVSGFLLQGDRMNQDLPAGSRGGTTIRYNFPVDGEYALKIELKQNNGGTILGFAQPNELSVFIDGVPIKQFEFGGREAAQRLRQTRGEDGQRVSTALRARFPAKAGPRTIGLAFRKTTSKPEGIRWPALPLTTVESQRYTDVDSGVYTVEIGGPFNPLGPGDTPSRRAVLLCRPSDPAHEVSCAAEILTTLGRRAFRRSVTDRDVQRLLGCYQIGRRDGEFEDGLEAALQCLLVSPQFLFRVERDPANARPGSVYRLTDVELASRLSFFLWSSIPDDALLELARRGQLHQPAVLERQVRRMLADRRADALVSNFAGQWLYLRNLRTVAPNAEEFPFWDDNLRDALQQETELFFASMLREDRPVPDLLTADYTFLNERLARHYGIPNVYGSHFRRVTLPDASRRGLLGQGSILTVTSYDNRTSPVKRGKWLLENILGAPPPPPPPDVPALKENGTDGRSLTMRERMEEHRKNPVCASCHARMDPLGFALENFDAIGRWRTAEAGHAIDASGALPSGEKFTGPTELSRQLFGHREALVGTVVEKLMTYALGRGVEYQDRPAIRAILRDAAAHESRWSSIVLGIVKSTPFQMRSVGTPASPTLSAATTGRVGQ